jgi:hypothetical protein
MRTNIIQDMLLITNKENYLSVDLDLLGLVEIYLSFVQYQVEEHLQLKMKK